MAQPFNTAPRPGESNLGYGLRYLPTAIANKVLTPFQPGGSLDLIHGGFLNPNTPGSITNQGQGLVAQLFGMSGGQQEVQQNLDKGMAYALAPATGPAAPPKPFASMSGNPAAFKNSDVSSAPALPSAMAKYPFNIPPGAIITSGFRTPEHNKAVGGVQDSYHMRTDEYGRPEAVDMVPAHGQTMESLFAQVKSLNPNADVIPEGDHVHIEPSKGGGGLLGAFNQAAGAVGLNVPTPQLDTSGYRNADALLQQAQGNVMKPFSAAYQTTPMPELPKPEPLQTPDYTAGDAAIAAAKPKEPFARNGQTEAEGELKVRRSDYFAGMAQALGSIDWSRNVGLGELFAKLGAGALMGAKAGDKEVQDKMEKFDSAMQNYQLAVAGRDDNKARESINIANQNVAEMNTYRQSQWQVNMQEWQKYEPVIQDGTLITKSKDASGKVVETHTPLDQSKTAAALYARANNQIAAANANSEYDWQVYRANREFAGAALPYAMADAMHGPNAQGRDGIAAFGLSEAAIAATETGRWQDLYTRYMPNGAKVAADTEAQARSLASIQPGQNPTEAQTKIMQNYISSQLMQDFVNARKSWVLVGGPGSNPNWKGGAMMAPSPEVLTSVATQREQDRKTRSSTNAKGQTTYSTEGDSPWGPENLSRYGYERH